MVELKKISILSVVIAAYGITWVGGHLSHARNIASHALNTYEAAQSKNNAMSAFAQEVNMVNVQAINLRPAGPKSEVKWSFPLLPGILIANSYYVNGPLWAEGGTKLIVYYGISSAVVCKLTKWIS